MAITMKPSSKIFGSFRDWLKDYLHNSSVAGCAYYVMSERPSKERIFWLIVHITSIIFIVFMTMKATIAYTTNRTVTTLETANYPVQEIDFPGIALCDLNKISRAAALEVASDLIGYLQLYSYAHNFTLQEVADLIKYLGHIYLFEFNESEKDKIELLHKLLTRKYKTYSSDFLLEKLRPKCSSLIKWCAWAGREMRDCEELYTTRKTGDGVCCTFNYVRRGDSFGTKNLFYQAWEAEQVRNPTALGSQFGLTMVLKNNFHDHFYKVLPILGYKILIFSPQDFPDVSSGGLREVIIPYGSESALNLRATKLYAHPDVSMYREHERDCRFANELPGIFEGYYSYSDCLVHCRLIDIIERCNCFPFFYPVLSDSDKVRFCDLMDLRCLNTYKNRFWSVRPRFEKLNVPYDDDDDNDNFGESKGVLNCSACLPACTDVNYEVTADFAPLAATAVPLGKGLLDVEGLTMVHIFFRRPGITKLRQDVLCYWYELMSNYGGICGFFLGISIISVIEFFYFFTLRLFKRTNNKLKDDKNSRFTFVEAARPSHRPLYWKEMMQPNFKY